MAVRGRSTELHLPRLRCGTGRHALALGLSLSLCAGLALASAPDRSPVPQWRPGSAAALAPAAPGPAAALPPASPSAAGTPGAAALAGQPGAGAPGAGAAPDLPQDPLAGQQMAALYLAGRHAPAGSSRPGLRPQPGAGTAGSAAPVSGAEPAPLAADAAEAGAMAPPRSLKPRWRPVPDATPAAPLAIAAVAQLPDPGGVAGLVRSLRPKARPKDLTREAPALPPAAIAPASLRIAPPDPGAVPGRRDSAKGGLCGIAGLSGSKLTPITSGACGVKDPVRLTAVHGVALSAPTTVDCSAARALSTWVSGVLIPTVGNTGNGVRQIDVAASYACRPRNNQRGAKMSEHGLGKAIDITAIQLKNGKSMSVLTGWNDRSSGPILKALHRGACGPFGTVLGPNANKFHRDHFHFDTASYRNGAYCR